MSPSDAIKRAGTDANARRTMLVSSSRAMYRDTISQQTPSFEGTANPGLADLEGGTARHPSRRVEALRATIEEMTPKELLELRMQTSLLACKHEGKAPSRRLKLALGQLERVAAALVQLEAASAYRSRLTATAEASEGMIQLIQMLPQFGVNLDLSKAGGGFGAHAAAVPQAATGLAASASATALMAPHQLDAAAAAVLSARNASSFYSIGSMLNSSSSDASLLTAAAAAAAAFAPTDQLGHAR